MFMPGEDKIHGGSLEDRFEPCAQVQTGAMELTVRVQRMMEVTNLPSRRSAGQFPFKPAQLLRVHVVTIERKKCCVALLVAVVTLASHIEWLVKSFVRIVVISQRGVELDVGIEESLVGILKLPLEILRSTVPI